MRERILCMGLVLLLVAKAASAQEVSIGRGLTGITELKAVVEELPPQAERYGITRESLANQVITAVKEKLSGVRMSSSAPSYLDVNLTFTGSALLYCASLTLKLFRPVKILIGLEEPEGNARDEIPYSAPVWGEQIIFRGVEQASGHVREVLETLLNKFLADYAHDNPQKPD